MFKALKKRKRKGHLTFQSNSIPQAVLLTSLVWATPVVTNVAQAENNAENAVELSTVNVEGSGETSTAPVSRKISTSGTKTTTPLNKTPQSVSVVTSDDIKEKGADSVSTALNYSSGVISNYRGSSNRNDEVMVRGSNTYAPQYLDGISFASGSSGVTIAPQIDPWLLDRVELIKGPASVLYGQSNPGGLISMTSKRPTAESLHQVEFGVGTNNQREAAFDFSGKANKDGTVLYRFTGIGSARDGQEQFVEEERYAIAPALTFMPTEDTTFTLLTNFQKDPKAGYRNFLPAEGTVKSNPNGSIPTDFFVSDPNWEKASREQKSVGYALEHKVNDALTVRQNARYADIKQDTQTIIYDYWSSSSQDTMNRWAQKFDDHVKTVGVDNQVQYDTKTGIAKHTILAGIDYKQFVYDTKTWTDYDSDGSLAINWVNPTYGIDTDDIHVNATNDEKQTRKQTGVYLQDQVEINKWNFLLSGRHDWADIQVDDHLADTVVKNKQQKTTGRAGILYAFDNGLSPYTSYSTSFEPITYLNADGELLKPTTAKQIEAGVKFQPKGSNSSATVSVFDLRQKNVATRNSQTYEWAQTGEIGSKGVELESNIYITEALKVSPNYTYTKAEILESEDGTEGNVPRYIPEHMASLWASYAFQNGLTTGAGMRYMGTTYGNDTNSFKVPAYDLYDLSVGYDLAKASSSLKGAKLQLNVNNVFNEKYVSSCGAAWACFYGSERSAMAKVSYSW